MTKSMGRLGVVLVSGLVLACSAKSSNSTGGAGNGGKAGTTGTGPGDAGGTGTAGAGTAGAGAAGVTGTAGSNSDGSVSDAVYPVDGRCPIQGASPRDGGICMCAADAPTVCGNACVNTMTDNDHCGGCTTTCGATSSCNAGKCGPAPTTLVPAATGCNVIHLALSAGTVYWSDSGHGTVQSIGTAAGSTAKTIAMTQMAPTLLGVFGTTLFWLDSGSRTIMKAALPTGAPTLVYTSPTDVIHGLTASPDGNTVYFSAGSHIAKVASSGGTATNVDDQADGIPASLALEGSTLVFGSDEAQDVDAIYLADGKVSQCGMRDASGNGFCTMGLRIARSQGSILFESIFLINSKVYWAHGPDLAFDSTVASGPNDAAATPVRIASTANFNPISAFTIQGTTAYLGEDGSIEKAPLVADSQTTILARGQMNPGSIAADATNVYWSNGGCAIMTMPAPP